MLPSVTKAKYINDYLIEVKFNDGTKKVIDFEPWLTGPIFKPLKTKTTSRNFLLMVRPSRGRTARTLLPKRSTMRMRLK